MSKLQPRDDAVSLDEIAAISKSMQGTTDVRAHGASTVGDLAEATGLSTTEVHEHLSRLRAERAFELPTKKRLPVIPIVGAVALLTGGFIILNRSQSDAVAGRRWPPVNIVTQPMGPGYSRQVQNNHLGETMIQQGPGAPPPGVRVDEIGQNSSFMGDGISQEVKRMSYDLSRKQLARSIAWLALMTTLQDIRHPQADRGPYRDSMGNAVTPQPGKVHFSVDGWVGSSDGWVDVSPVEGSLRDYAQQHPPGMPQADYPGLAPLAEKLAPSLQLVADGIYKKALDAQQEGLSLKAVDPIILPPPGYKVAYLGRRRDSQEGTLFAFAPIDEKAVAKRLELAIRNAMARDAKPPIGTWTETDRLAMKHPVPSLARVEVTAPNSAVLTFDVPTKGSALATVLREQAGKAAHEVERSNQSALTQPTDQQPTDREPK